MALPAFLNVPSQFLTAAQLQQRNNFTARLARPIRTGLTAAEERTFQRSINAQNRVIAQQNRTIRAIQADFRVAPNEVNRFVAATNRRLEAARERQRIQTERNIARQSNPSVAARLQSQTLRAAEIERRALLRYVAISARRGF